MDHERRDGSHPLQTGSESADAGAARDDQYLTLNPVPQGRGDAIVDAHRAGADRSPDPSVGLRANAALCPYLPDARRLSRNRVQRIRGREASALELAHLRDEQTLQSEFRIGSGATH
ncbi:hypothetical protein [Sphingomonas sp. 10B4]|uniref:hypothetical protein n=1 Tax=Sphingomonas sp. 10B4 TaxID=3048575 RepID=UPI002AB36D18|nr:hypothetical protein [Sphingomonas sp. 10B4]MDY7526056.1 hypothetical protein [Sphingomonas sp. 10B4]MEB0281022.1 hypothetical protein [Sphingomonas sp. 10B4]